MGPLRIGTRGSDLALWQARRVALLLERRHVTSDLVIIRTTGDEGEPQPAGGEPVKGTFTKEIELALLRGRIDVAVHSLKDLETEAPNGLWTAAFPERADPRDALITREGMAIDQLRQGARVGTSSVRRRAALLAYRPDLTVVPLRGNVPTRLRRVRDGDVDAAIVAMAGVTRLDANDPLIPLDPDVFVPAPGQGALAIQVRLGDRSTEECIMALDDEEVRVAAEAETSAIARLGGGCQVPIGALCREGQLHVCVYATDGSRTMAVRHPVPRHDPRGAGQRAAEELLDRGADRLIAARERPALSPGEGNVA